MNHRLPLACLLASCAFFATATASRAQLEAGLLGKRYVSVSAFFENVRNAPVDDGKGIELNANLPVASTLDAGIRLSNETFDTYDIKDRRYGAYVTGYMDMDSFKPYLELSASNTSQSSRIQGTTYKNSESLASMAVGLEAPLSRSTAVFGQAAYNRYFDSSLDEYWTYKVGITTWVRPKLMLQGAVAFFENDSVTFSLGMGIRF